MDEISDSELKRRLAIWRGKPIRSKHDRPPPGTGKSREFHLRDIALLARIDRSDITAFMKGRRHFGRLTKGRLCRTLEELERGFVTKTQYGVYHFFDEPQRPTMLTMQFNMKTGRIEKGEQPNSIVRLPKFKDVFGG